MNFNLMEGISNLAQIYAGKLSNRNVGIVSYPIIQFDTTCPDYAFHCKKCGDYEDHISGVNEYIDLDLLKIFCDNHKHEVPSWDNVKTFVHDQKEPLKNDVHYRLTLGVSKPPQIELPIELPEVVGRRFRGVK
jgi:hypothetical protein